MNKTKNYAIILASGIGKRFGSDLPKQFTKIGNKTVIEYTLDTFNNSEVIDEIILVVPEQYLNLVSDITSKGQYKKLIKTIAGGATRKASSQIAVNAIDDNEANVLIHDGARPFVTQKIISDCVNALKTHDAVGVAIKTTDTVIEVQNDYVKSIPDRNNLRNIQTPQCFKLSLIKKAHKLSENNNDFTDDCGLVAKHALAQIFLVEGDPKNFKLTYPQDIYLAQKYCEFYNI